MIRASAPAYAHALGGPAFLASLQRTARAARADARGDLGTALEQ